MADATVTVAVVAASASVPSPTTQLNRLTQPLTAEPANSGATTATPVNDGHTNAEKRTS